MKNIKMIVCDLDDTLLNSEKTVTEFTANTIKSLRDKGYLFTIASGRPENLIFYKLKDWNLEGFTDYIIYANGFGYYNCKTQKDTTFYAIDNTIVDSISEEFKDYDVSLFYHHGPYVVCDKLGPEALRLANRDNIPCKVLGLDFFRTQHTSKFLIGGTIETINEIEKIAKHYPNVRDFRATPYQYEYVDNRDSKSNALKELLKECKLTTDEIIVFGDMINDVDMLECTKNSVAMINGDDNAKKVSNYQTTYSNNEDGVAKFLLENLE